MKSSREKHLVHGDSPQSALGLSCRNMPMFGSSVFHHGRSADTWCVCTSKMSSSPATAVSAAAASMGPSTGAW